LGFYADALSQLKLTTHPVLKIDLKSGIVSGHKKLLRIDRYKMELSDSSSAKYDTSDFSHALNRTNFKDGWQKIRSAHCFLEMV